jgi:tryptophan-rich sensory protein
MASITYDRQRPFAQISVLVLLIFLIPPFAVAFIGSQWTDTGPGTWYEGIEKPAWNPPGWVFAPVWSALYLAMAFAAWVVWRSSESLRHAVPSLGAWSIQLALNLAWTYVFFERESPEAGVVDIALLWLAILLTILLFVRRSRVAALLLVPYILWVTYAAAITIEIARLN